MLAQIGSRLGRLVLVLFLVTAFLAVLTELMPGDPVTVIAPFASDEQRSELREELGFNEPLPTRYANWVGGFVTGDLGYTYSGPTSKDSVAEKVKDTLPVSLELMILAQLMALALAIPLGVTAARFAGGWIDRVISGSSFLLLSLPPFVLAFVLTYYLKVKFGLFTVQGGFVRFSEDPIKNLTFMVIPATSLALGQVAVLARLLRADMIGTLQQDFIVMARSKGMSTARIMWRHALRPSSITLITAAGLNVGTLIGGSVVIERIFSIPGIGQQIAQALIGRQVVALQGLVAVIAVIYVALNVGIDILYRVIDPRIRNA